MTISNICVGFVAFIVLFVITGLLGWLNMFVADEEDLFAIFVAWIISTAGLATCLTYIFVQNNFI